jgi:nitrite reductase/ring-hydroxylating ferredoxin subunit
VLTAELSDEVGDGLFWDDASPYHYLRRAASDVPGLFVIGGEDHKTGQGDEQQSLARLDRYVREKFHVRNIQCRWSAELFEPADGLPYIGLLPRTKHLYVATGFSGTGLTWGTAAGQLLAELILGHDDPLAAVVSPARWKVLAAAPSFLRENVNAAQHFVADRFRVERMDSFEDLACGEGRVARHDGQIVAAYRDERGDLHLRSATCTHAGCIVAWNDAERTWDCPCHGGRYAATGERLYGPPPADLSHIREAAHV